MRLRIGRVDEDSASRLTHPGEVGPAESVKAGASSDRHAHHYDRHAPPPPGSRRRPTPPARRRQRRGHPSPSPARHTVRARRRAQPAPAPPARTRRCRHLNRHAEPRHGRTGAHRDSRRQPPATPPTPRPSLAADGARRDLSLTLGTYSPPVTFSGVGGLRRLPQHRLGGSPRRSGWLDVAGWRPSSRFQPTGAILLTQADHHAGSALPGLRSDQREVFHPFVERHGIAVGPVIRGATHRPGTGRVHRTLPSRGPCARLSHASNAPPAPEISRTRGTLLYASRRTRRP